MTLAAFLACKRPRNPDLDMCIVRFLVKTQNSYRLIVDKTGMFHRVFAKACVNIVANLLMCYAAFSCYKTMLFDMLQQQMQQQQPKASSPMTYINQVSTSRIIYEYE